MNRTSGSTTRARYALGAIQADGVENAQCAFVTLHGGHAASFERLVWRRLYRLAETRFKLEDRQPTGCWKIHRGFAPVRPIGLRPPLPNPPAC